jgi:hypothetical protein|tara:strand:+ start:40 stop:321 length:282 start_codon:yes stop_codon:yes gene_type:complete
MGICAYCFENEDHTEKTIHLLDDDEIPDPINDIYKLLPDKTCFKCNKQSLMRPRVDEKYPQPNLIYCNTCDVFFSIKEFSSSTYDSNNPIDML